MWFESSTEHKGQRPLKGPLRLRTSVLDGRRPMTSCHRKILIFKGNLISQRRLSSTGLGVGKIARYNHNKFSWYIIIIDINDMGIWLLAPQGQMGSVTETTTVMMQGLLDFCKNKI